MTPVVLVVLADLLRGIGKHAGPILLLSPFAQACGWALSVLNNDD